MLSCQLATYLCARSYMSCGQLVYVQITGEAVGTGLVKYDAVACI